MVFVEPRLFEGDLLFQGVRFVKNLNPENAELVVGILHVGIAMLLFLEFPEMGSNPAGDTT